MGPLGTVYTVCVLIAFCSVYLQIIRHLHSRSSEKFSPKTLSWLSDIVPECTLGQIFGLRAPLQSPPELNAGGRSSPAQVGDFTICLLFCAYVCRSIIVIYGSNELLLYLFFLIVYILILYSAPGEPRNWRNCWPTRLYRPTVVVFCIMICDTIIIPTYFSLTTLYWGELLACYQLKQHQNVLTS